MMGWLSDICSSVASAASSAWSAVKSTVSEVWEGAKSVARETVGWIADKAENFVDSVKEVYRKVKPAILFVQDSIDKYAKFIPIPWLQAAVIGFNSITKRLMALENSPILKNVERAVQWIIVAAKKYKSGSMEMTPSEVDEALEHRDTFREAAEKLPASERKCAELAGMLSEHIITRSTLADLLETGEFTDFEHYLRMRAVQKLLKDSEKIFTEAQSTEEIHDDDIFAVKIGGSLIARVPKVSDQDMIRLDGLILKRHGKSLIPFVFEELIVAWGYDLRLMERQWTVKNSELAKIKRRVRELDVAQRIGTLSATEAQELAERHGAFKKVKEQMDTVSKRCIEQENYIAAAEGFLQTLEKSGEQLEEDGLGFLAEDGVKVGQLVIRCAQNGEKWEALTEEDREMIIDYANIFREASKRRAEQLPDMVTVEAAA